MSECSVRLSRYKPPQTILFINSMGRTVCHRSEDMPEAVVFDIRSGERAARNGAVVIAERNVMRTLMLICAAQGQPITTRDLVELFYGPDEDGGPDNAEVKMRGLIMMAKRVATALGLAVYSRGQHGYVAHDVLADVGAAS